MAKMERVVKGELSMMAEITRCTCCLLMFLYTAAILGFSVFVVGLISLQTGISIITRRNILKYGELNTQMLR